MIIIAIDGAENGHLSFGHHIIEKNAAPKIYDQKKNEPNLNNLSPKKNSESFEKN